MGLVQFSELDTSVRTSKGSASTATEHFGGDDSVPRDKAGRPRLVTYCWVCGGEGLVPSPTGSGKMIKCRGCKGLGVREKTYQRVTTFIDVIDDKSLVMQWQQRKVLIGVARDTAFLRGVLAADDETSEGRNLLNRRAEAAKALGGANDKSDRGTHLHELSECADGVCECHGYPGVRDRWSPVDALDMTAYMRESAEIPIVHSEKLVVNELLGVAGTPDRIRRAPERLVAPDGKVIESDELLITDLKTGRIDYGALKMAMQLSIYSRSDLWVPGSPDRAPIENINYDWGIIYHLAAGSGECNLYWADLNLGWEAVKVASEVRGLRKRKNALVPFPCLHK